MKKINLEQLIQFHGKIIKATGGSEGIRDRGVLESALRKAEATFDRKERYDRTIRKITVIGYALIKNHGFVDGNKRIGASMILLLLRLNQIQIKYDQDELVELGMKTAEGQFREEHIEQWIEEHRV